MTTDDTYYERGINLRHGYLTEYYVDDADFIVKIPQGLKDVGVLLEPITVVEKGITQAYEIQRRLRVWHPKRAAVLGRRHHRAAGGAGAPAAGDRRHGLRADPQAVPERRPAGGDRRPLRVDRRPVGPATARSSMARGI